MPIFDFYCSTPECSEKTSEEQCREFLVRGEDECPECTNCKLPMTKVVSYAPKGYVKGTHNPVKQ